MSDDDFALFFMRFVLVNWLRGLLDRLMLADVRELAATDEEVRKKLEELEP